MRKESGELPKREQWDNNPMRRHILDALRQQSPINGETLRDYVQGMAPNFSKQAISGTIRSMREKGEIEVI